MRSKPGELWVTHGAEEALLYQASKMGIKARALSLVGYEDEDEWSGSRRCSTA